MTEKNVNYTDAMTAELVGAYTEAQNESERENVITEFAQAFGKNVKSVRAKLVREGVYIKKEYKTKTGTSPERKAAIVADIAALLGVDSDIVGSLEKATKKSLELLRGTLQKTVS